MQDPDDEPEEPKSFADILAEALGKVPPEDYDRIWQEALDEMHAEAMMGVGTPMYFPPEVLERICAYEKEHAIDQNYLIPVAIKSTKPRKEEVVELVNRYIKNPDSFEWPIEDPLMCVSIAFMRACATWLTKKIDQEYGGEDEEDDDQGDWWKVEGAE